MEREKSRLNGEWVSINAIREILKIATKGDISKSTYDDALEIGGDIYPDLLGEDVSLIRRERLSNTTREYIQKAKISTKRDGKEVQAIELVKTEISNLESLIEFEPRRKEKDQLTKRLSTLLVSKIELEPKLHTENQLIFRDAYNVDRNLPVLFSSKASKSYSLPNDNNLTIRVLHPDNPEHITGADVIYEYHNDEDETVSLVFIQYKLWEDKKLYISDERLKNQLERLKEHTCTSGLCKCETNDKGFRFPFCAAFLRPTDSLQSADQRLISRGEHIPICQIEKVKTKGPRGGEYLEYKKMKDVSLSSVLFEDLFNSGKIGSRSLKPKELKSFYETLNLTNSEDTAVFYAQEYSQQHFL